MAAKLFFLPHLTATVNGIAVPGAKASFYQTETTTPLTVYQDAALSVPHTSPVVANGAGRFPAIYLDDTKVYRLILTDRDDAELSGGDIDPFVPGTVPDASALQPYQDACEAAAVAASADAADAASSETSAAASNAAAANAAADAEASEVNSEAAAVLAALAADAALNAMQGVAGASLNAATRGTLSLLGTSLPAILTESGREGIFVFDASNLSSSVAADTAQGIYVAPASDTTGASGAWVRKFDGPVSADWFGAIGGGVVDDTAAVQAALNYLASVGGGTLLITGNHLVGGLTIAVRDINIRGRSRSDRLTIKNGTTGITWSENWGSIRDLGIYSQGTKGDGLGTNGVLFSKGVSGQSSGHFILHNVDIENFSGFGFKAVNALDFYVNEVFIASCTTGLQFARGGTGGADFSTTTFSRGLYLSACTTGLDATYVYRSRWNVIGELCGVAVKVTAGDVTLDRCYFESNTTLGCQVIDAYVHDFDTYSNNATTDAVSRTWSVGVVTATDRGYRKDTGLDSIAKRFGVLGQYGVALQYLADHGTDNSLGLKYGTSTVALKRGPNLLVSSAWEGEGNGVGGGAELVGWVASKAGYEISGATTGARGMRQTVTVTAGQTYVLEWKTSNVSGVALTTARVGTDTVTNGVSFVASASGSVIVKLFGVQTGAHENIVYAFSLSQVDSADSTLVADAQDRLSRPMTERGRLSMAAAPTTGNWSVGEIVWNSAPASGGTIGWVCVTTGRPGTWAAFGASTSTSAGIGYATGAGGTITQATSKATGVTLNKVCGSITLNNAALAANTIVSFTFTNSQIAADDDVRVWVKSGNASVGSYRVAAEGNAAGSRTIVVENKTAGSLSEAIVLGFTVLKAVAA